MRKQDPDENDVVRSKTLTLENGSNYKSLNTLVVNLKLLLLL